MANCDNEIKKQKLNYYINHPIFCSGILPLNLIEIIQSYETFDMCKKCNQWHPIVLDCICISHKFTNMFYMIENHTELFFFQENDQEIWNYLLKQTQNKELIFKFNDWCPTNESIVHIGTPLFQFFNPQKKDFLPFLIITEKQLKRKRRKKSQ